MMAPGIAATVVVALSHLFHHVEVADGRADEIDADRLKITLETEVRHDGRDNRRLCQQSLVLPILRNDGQRLVAIYNMTALINNHNTVRVAVERNADIGAQ